MAHDHSHLTPHADDISLLEEFRILMEEQPERAERVLRRAKEMHGAVRRVSIEMQEMMALDDQICPTIKFMDPETSPAMLGHAIGVMQTRERLMAVSLNNVSEQLYPSIGCLSDACSEAWTDFFTPPAPRDPSERPPWASGGPLFGGMEVYILRGDGSVQFETDAADDDDEGEPS